MGLDTPILRSVQATHVPQHETESDGVWPQAAEFTTRATRVSLRFAASSEPNTNDSRPVRELQLNSSARAARSGTPISQRLSRGFAPDEV